MSSKEEPKDNFMLLQCLLFQNKLIRLRMKTKNWLIKLSDKLCLESVKKKKISLFLEKSDLYANIPQHLSPKLKDFDGREVFLNIKFITALMK